MFLLAGLFYTIAVIPGLFVHQVDGQCDADSRPLQINATAIPQYVTSTNFPDPYEAYADCAWIITAPSPHDKIIINIQSIDIEGSSLPCKYDYVEVYDGADTSAAQLAKLCNQNQYTVNALVSSTDTFYVTFISDWGVQYDGFDILVFTNSTDYQLDCDVTNTMIATADTTFVMSPNLPDVYESNFTCELRIYPNTTYFAVRIGIVFMDIESSDSCANDALRFFSVGETSSVEAAAECREAVDYESDNFPMDVSGTYIQINFTTDFDNNYLGFMLVFTEVFKGINLTSPENEGTIEITVPEDLGTGHINESVCVIVLTYTGSLTMQIFPTYEATTDQNISLSDIQIFSMTDSPPYAYLELVSSLDYEVISKFSVLVTLIDSDVTQITYSVTFNITITDIDDVAPVFNNLPGNYTLQRGLETGDLIYTVNATDGDGTEENSQVLYQILSGDDDSMFEINNTTGEIRLIQDATLIPLTTLDYVLTIAAYSGSISGGSLSATADVTVNVSPDSPPVCSHTSVWGETLDVNLAGPGTSVVLIDTWSCTDDNVNLTYTLESVSPTLNTTLFDIDTAGEVSLLRSFSIFEVTNRQFMLEIGVTDSVGQMVTFYMFMNVTSLSCLPNPRNLYVRMDQEPDTVILNGFNCTNEYGLTYVLQQYPAGTFEVNSATNGTVLLILKARVVKIKFYSLVITITDGVDIAVLRFKVIIQTRRCGIASRSAEINLTPAWRILFLLCSLFLFNI